jgi:hypothetical protein
MSFKDINEIRILIFFACVSWKTKLNALVLDVPLEFWLKFQASLARGIFY